MFKLLIVDDEELDREGLKRFLNWNELGFEVVGTAESARKALEISEHEHVDVVLTDIVMPDMNGLEMVSEIKKISLGIKVVILSGYGEFQYAKESIRLGAYEYLLKPVVLEELRKVFIGIREVLQNEEKTRSDNLKYIDILKEQFLNNLAKRMYTDVKLIERLIIDIGLKLAAEQFCIFRIRIAPNFNACESESQISENKQKIIASLEEYLNKNGLCYSFNNDINEMAILFSSFSPIDLKNEEMVNSLYDVKNSMQNMIFIGIGGCYSSMLEIKNSYIEAGKALEYCIAKGDNFIYSFRDISIYASEKFIITEQTKNAILSYLTQLDVVELSKFIFMIFDELNLMTNVTMHTFHYTCIEIIIIFQKHISNVVENISEIKYSWANAINDILETDSIDTVKKYMHEFVTVQIGLINKMKDKGSSIIIDNAKKYIQEHYSEDITLIKLAETLYVHPTHLSRLFKDKTGENFIDYLIKIRIEKAKALLSNLSYKVYDIAGMIGYDSPGYFSRTFKEMVGLTPKEYRDNMVQ